MPLGSTKNDFIHENAELASFLYEFWRYKNMTPANVMRTAIENLADLILELTNY